MRARTSKKMAKKLKRKNLTAKDTSNYGERDPLLDLLRPYYIKIGIWDLIVARDKELQKRNKQKEINNIRRYK